MRKIFIQKKKTDEKNKSKSGKMIIRLMKYTINIEESQFKKNSKKSNQNLISQKLYYSNLLFYFFLAAWKIRAMIHIVSVIYIIFVYYFMLFSVC